MLINGDRIESNRHIEVRNPARPSEIVGTTACGSVSDVSAAIAAAKAAQVSWSRLSFVERALRLRDALDNFAVNIEQRAKLYARENGRVLSEALGELRSVPIIQKMTLDLAEELDEGRNMRAPLGRTFVNYIPYGVVVSIVPWNAPVTLAFLQVIPALLAGNCVVVKPPETCPLTLIDAVVAIAEKLPPGVVNILAGRAAEIGDILTTHPDVAKIGFTGGIPSARRIMANAAQSIKGVTLELGGNDPGIVLDDVDLGDATMQRIAHGAFSATGQVCMAIKRVYVAEKIFPAFEKAFKSAVDRYVVGDGLKSGVTMGPMHTAHARDGALTYIHDSKKRGANVSVLGQIQDKTDFEHGYFVRPAIVTEIGDDAPVMVEEQFCPVLPVVTFKSIEEVVERANDSIFGLCASVWSRDTERALKIARELQAGTIFVNAHGVASVNRRAPYGGIKQSGIGSKASVEGVMEYLQLQTITTNENVATN